MSNSSEVESCFDEGALATPLVCLLRAMAVEWTKIADDLNKLGDSIPRSDGDMCDPQTVIGLQAFDSILQRAQGQSSLLSRLVLKLAGDDSLDPKTLAELWKDIPFHSTRVLFEGAVGGEGVLPLEPTEDGEVEWL